MLSLRKNPILLGNSKEWRKHAKMLGEWLDKLPAISNGDYLNGCAEVMGEQYKDGVNQDE